MRRPLIVFVAAIGFGVLSAALTSPAVFAVGIGLVLLEGAAWVLVVLSARSLAVERIIDANEVQEDAPVRVGVSLARRNWLPVQLAAADYSRGWLALVDGRASLELRVGRPGSYSLAPTTLRLRDPVGLFERRILAGRVESLLVLPAPRSRAGVHLSHSGLPDDPEPHGLAAYAPGTPLSRIHWPTVARGAGLQVRHVAPSPDGLPLVVVETLGAASRAALDWTARTAAGHILTLARNAGCRVLLPGDATATTVVGLDPAWRAMHRRLARLADMPTLAAPAQPAGAPTVHVRAVAAPAEPVAPPSLPPGVLPTAEWPPGR
jgi:uncharacterized protein (DUF58 family)